MSLKSAQREGWDQATPRGLIEMFRGRRHLSDEERLETRRVAVARVEELRERLRLSETMPAGPMRDALVAKHKTLIEGIEAFLERVG